LDAFNPFDIDVFHWDVTGSRAILDGTRIDVGAGTISFAASGPLTVSAVDAAGTPTHVLTTQWNRDGNELRASNSQAVAEFMAGVPSACGFELNFNSGTALPAGRHTAALDVEFMGAPVQSFRREFQYGGRGTLPAMEMTVE
jgi:hypothetical protein